MAHGTTLRRKVGWTLLTGFIGFAGSTLFDNVLHVSLAEQLIITILVGGVTLLVQYLADVEHHLNESERHHRATIEDLNDRIRQGFESVSEASGLMAEIERSVVPPVVLKQVIRRSADVKRSAPPLMQALAESETKRLADTLQSLADGHEVFYDGEDREFLLAIARRISVSVLATSWATVQSQAVGFEAGFWLSDLGARYLDLQRAALRRGVVIRRVFIVESPMLVKSPELSQILAMQQSAGIEVRLVDGRQAAQDGGLSDFVVFDEQLCYDTTPVTRREAAGASGAPWRLTTRLVLDQETVRQRIERFDELWAGALPVGGSDIRHDGAAVLPHPEPLGPA